LIHHSFDRSDREEDVFSKDNEENQPLQVTRPLDCEKGSSIVGETTPIIPAIPGKFDRRKKTKTPALFGDIKNAPLIRQVFK